MGKTTYKSFEEFDPNSGIAKNMYGLDVMVSKYDGMPNDDLRSVNPLTGKLLVEFKSQCPKLKITASKEEFMVCVDWTHGGIYGLLGVDT